MIFLKSTPNWHTAIDLTTKYPSQHLPVSDSLGADISLSSTSLKRDLGKGETTGKSVVALRQEDGNYTNGTSLH